MFLKHFLQADTIFYRGYANQNDKFPYILGKVTHNVTFSVI